ncbi:electron transport complex, RnfABCDGE type, G subunit [Lachnospiraceae bacterium KH1T2]|nr:electron transport complex, RnfABCDGE type, G subunit [Lachnospiraceae bacterium KH1T2]
MSNVLNVSPSPHVRSKLSTGQVMYDVVLALIPATVVGVYHFGLHAALVILTSIVSAVLSEFVFDYIAKKENTIKDGSAVVTGLLLALCLPGGVPLYIPFIGAVFAIIIVKSFFGGLGKNVMNPALAARCFLLISFGTTMTSYAVNGISGATPLSDTSVSVVKMALGLTNGVIGCSTFALFIGGLYLWVVGGITIEIPAATILSFVAFMGIFGGKGFSLNYLMGQLFAGGIIMAAFFMATDPVSSPVTSKGQILYGIIVGVLAGLFRILGSSADSVSYAVIMSNLFTPMIDEFIIPKPYAFRSGAQVDKTVNVKKDEKSSIIPVPVIVLGAIAIIAGLLLSSVYETTKETIEQQNIAKNMESYKAVMPDAASFENDETMTAAVDALNGEVYGTDFGNVLINSVVAGKDSSGNTVGYVVSVSSKDGFDGQITLSAGIALDGTLNGISFTELNETAGMGMRADEDEFKGQFKGRTASKFTLNKAGGSTAEDEINSISGASITSGAVVNAVNAALDFIAANAQ